MTDISKCEGIINEAICAERNDCWRYLAPISLNWQTWADPVVNDGKCESKIVRIAQGAE